MPLYEVVDPAERDERGVMYDTLTMAMVNAGHDLEVWELADDAEQTRMVCCWPDPEFAATDRPERPSEAAMRLMDEEERSTAKAGDAGRVTPAKAKAAERWQPALTREQEVKTFVQENVGRAEREATAILAEHNPVSPDKVHALVSLAWGKGFIAGFASGSETFAQVLTRVTEETIR